MISRTGVLYRRLRRARNVAIISLRRLRHVHPTSYVHPMARVSRDLQAAEYVFIAHGCELAPQVRIGRYSMLAPHVAIIGDDHVTGIVGVPIQFGGRPIQRGTEIGADVWIGYGAIVLRGVTIGDGAIVGAGAVVTRSIPPFEVWAGIPARQVVARFNDDDERGAHKRALQGPLIDSAFAEPLPKGPGNARLP